MTTQKEANFESLLKSAIEQKGLLLKAYSFFHNYSLGNQLFAMFECASRGLELGPINTFKGWQSLGRNVKKGSKAIALCMPVTCKGEKEKSDGSKEGYAFTRFIFRNNWFVLSQTEGEAIEPKPIPTWDKAQALKTLEIEEIAFNHPNGNCQGYAKLKQIAVSPIAALPFKTLFHEMAHVLLGHTMESQLSDIETTSKDIKELEAEATALLCLESLDLPGADYCRGYIQEWYKGAIIPEKNAKRIIMAANQILKAGTPSKEISC